MTSNGNDLHPQLALEYSKLKIHFWTLTQPAAGLGTCFCFDSGKSNSLSPRGKLLQRATWQCKCVRIGHCANILRKLIFRHILIRFTKQISLKKINIFSHTGIWIIIFSPLKKDINNVASRHAIMTNYSQELDLRPIWNHYFNVSKNEFLKFSSKIHILWTLFQHIKEI